MAWAFSFVSFSQAFTSGQLTNPSLLAPYACFWAAGIGTGWTTTLVTWIGHRFSNQYEKEADKMSWILSSLGITKGPIPFALSDPFRVIPSFMIGGAVSIGVAILLWLIFSIIGCAISTTLLLGLKYIKTKPILEQKVHTWKINVLSLGIVPSIKKQQLKKLINYHQVNKKNIWIKSRKKQRLE
uniref:Hypothetical pts system II component n-terminal and c-terminal truncated transmembrane protein n=1 Tax=Spiroplasma citri TaxID=2133 RepID=Q14LD2_SPICI|nr:hypothetical pts system II component n-terminal and c-terminal truncated transmembrane protein [Spiroplasma citri]